MKLKEPKLSHVGDKVNLVDLLNDTVHANELFSQWFRENNWRYQNMKVLDLLKEGCMGFQIAAFTDFLASNNIGIIVKRDQYYLHIINNDVMYDIDKRAEFLYKPEEDGTIWLYYKTVNFNNWIAKNPGLVTFYTTIFAIAAGMWYINNFKRGLKDPAKLKV